MTGEQAAQREPVFLRHLALGDQQIAGETGFRRQQVVPGGVAAALAQVVADAQQVARLVVEQLEVHLAQVVTPGDKAVDGLQADLGAALGVAQILEGRHGGELIRPGDQSFEVVPQPEALPAEDVCPVPEFLDGVGRQCSLYLPGALTQSVQQALRVERSHLRGAVLSRRLQDAVQGFQLHADAGNKRMGDLRRQQ